MFSTLETSEFVVSEEQCFLHTYRTICHELYAKMGALRAVPVTREHSDRGLSVDEQREFQQHAHWLEMGIHRGLANQRRFKSILDQALLTGDRACIETVAVEFAGDLCVATCGGFSPNIDLQGNQLQVLHDLDRPMVEGLSLSSDVSSEGVAVVFGWLRGERAPSTFVDGLLGLSGDLIAATIPQLMLYYLENTYFSSAWWKSLSKQAKDTLRAQGRNPNPYYSERVLIPQNVTGWKLKSIQRYGGA